MIQRYTLSHFMDSKSGQGLEILVAGVGLPQSWFLKAASHWLKAGSLVGEAHFKVKMHHL